ncbi:MAG: NUDIX domain-containing protein [Candidatus Moraniibacteriota bacterium]
MGKHLPTNVLTSYLVLVRDEKVLLARRSNTGYRDGQYSLPAGHVEPGESFTAALLREVDEEIGVHIALEGLAVPHILHRKGEDGSERVDAFFLVSRWEGEVQNREPEKCDDLSWFPMDRLPENTIPYIRTVLENIRRGIFYSEYGW